MTTLYSSIPTVYCRYIHERDVALAELLRDTNLTTANCLLRDPRRSVITCTHNMSKVVRLATIARGGGHKRHINSKNLTGHATQHTTGTPSKACTPCMGGRRDTAGSCPSDSRPRSRRGWEGAAAAPAERRRPAAARTEARSSLPAGHSAVETAVHTNYRAARWKMGAGM